MRPVNTCVLGVGLSGLTFHVPFLLALPELFVLHSVLERNPQTSAGKVGEKFGVSPKIHRTFDDVLGDKEIELVIVGTPNHTHYEFAKAALEAGKHVLVDKPVTTTVAEAKELGSIAKSKGLILYAFQNRRWDSDFLALKNLIQNEPENSRLGNTVEFESHFDRYRPSLKGTWKDEALPGAGQVFDLGTHLIDQALVLFGRPTSITAFVQNTRQSGAPEVDDTFTIFMRYDPGGIRKFGYPVTVILRSHVLSVRTKQLRYIVRGTKGTYLKFGLDVQEDQLRVMSDPKQVYSSQFGLEPESICGVLEYIGEDGTTVQAEKFPSRDPGAYINLFKNLAGAIRNGEELAVKWEEAIQVIEMVELAHKSSKQGVTIKVDD